MAGPHIFEGQAVVFRFRLERGKVLTKIEVKGCVGVELKYTSKYATSG